MSIQNELSSDIAVALIARGGNDPEQLKEMKDLIFRIHATLRENVAMPGERLDARTRPFLIETISQKSKAGAN